MKKTHKIIVFIALYCAILVSCITPKNTLVTPNISITKIVDTLYIKGEDGKDSLIYVTKKCPEPEKKTNKEIREERKDKKLNYKLKIAELEAEIKRQKLSNDSLKTVSKLQSKQIKEDGKNKRNEDNNNTDVKKSDNKTKVKIEAVNKWAWYAYGVLTLLVIEIILFIVIKFF